MDINNFYQVKNIKILCNSICWTECRVEVDHKINVGGAGIKVTSQYYNTFVTNNIGLNSFNIQYQVVKKLNIMAGNWLLIYGFDMLNLSQVNEILSSFYYDRPINSHKLNKDYEEDLWNFLGNHNLNIEQINIILNEINNQY